MGETTGTGVDEAEAAAERLETALARIAEGLAKTAPARDPASGAGPDTAVLAERLDGLIEIVRAELTATAGLVGKTD